VRVIFGHMRTVPSSEAVLRVDSEVTTISHAGHAGLVISRAGIGGVLRFRVSYFVFRVSGFVFRFSGLGFPVSGLGFRVSGFGSRVSGSGFRVSGF